jgi:hypothetical protein
MPEPIKPTYAIWAWGDEKQVMFSVIEDMTIGYCKQFYDYHKVFFGKHATVFVFYSDYELTVDQLLAAAERFMHGNYIRYDIDLYNMIVKISEGVDKTNPRQ